jgi:hypothetical protein
MSVLVVNISCYVSWAIVLNQQNFSFFIAGLSSMSIPILNNLSFLFFL